jgi:gas vesicle protein
MGRFSGTKKVFSRVSKLLSFKKKPVVESEKRKEIKRQIEELKKNANAELKNLDNYIKNTTPDKHDFVRHYTQFRRNSNTITQKIHNTAPNSRVRAKLVARKKEEDALKNTYSDMKDEIESFGDELRERTTEFVNLTNQEIANLENKLKDSRIGGTRKRRKYKKRH